LCEGSAIVDSFCGRFDQSNKHGFRGDTKAQVAYFSGSGQTKSQHEVSIINVGDPWSAGLDASLDSETFTGTR